MPIKELTPMSAAQQQLDSYNRAGGAGATNTFSLPAGTAWAVVGTIVADVVVIGDVPTLEAAIDGLSEVDVVEPLHWGQAPDEILANEGLPEPTHETVLAVAGIRSQVVNFGGGDGQNDTRKLSPATPIKPPLDKKYVVWALAVPASLDQTAIAALKVAIAGAHAGLSAAYVLLKGTTDEEIVGNATLSIEARTRIDRIPVEEP